MSCTQSVWEAWWLKYLTANVLFTLYATHQDGYAVDHREVGYHHKQKGLALYRSVVPRWEEERELENLPDSPDMIGEAVRRTVRQLLLRLLLRFVPAHHQQAGRLPLQEDQIQGARGRAEAGGE